MDYEQQVITAAHSGDIRSFERLVGLYERRIYAYLFRLAGRREDAEDLTQETFVKVWKHLGSFDLSKKFSTWIYTIATRTFYDFVRKHRQKDVPFLDEQHVETIGDHDTYKRVLARLDLEAALARIKPVARAALLLQYRDGYTYEEIGSILDLPLNTVKTAIRRGKLALRTLL